MTTLPIIGMLTKEYQSVFNQAIQRLLGSYEVHVVSSNHIEVDTNDNNNNNNKVKIYRARSDHQKGASSIPMVTTTTLLLEEENNSIEECKEGIEEVKDSQNEDEDDCDNKNSHNFIQVCNNYNKYRVSFH